MRAPLLALVLLAPTVLAAQRPAADAAAGAPPVVIADVTIVDVATGRLVPHRTVIVRGSRISAVSDAAGARLPKDARIVDGSGRFLIPGFWDMHVHTFRNRMDAPGVNTDDSEVFFPAFVANGVTGVRDMSTDLADHVQIRRWAAARLAGTLVAPRMVGGSTLLTGVPPAQPNGLPLPTAAVARRVVDSLIDGGVGFLKLYGGLSREAYFAAAEAARRRGVPFAGHVTGSVTLAEASDVGQRSVEHLNEALVSCSARERATAERLGALARDSTITPDSARSLRRSAVRGILDRFDVRECTPLFARLMRNRTWQVPTFTVKRPRAFAHDSAIRADSRLRFVSRQLMTEWQATGLRALNAMSPEDVALQREIYRLEQRVLGAMHAAGVPILAGTDVHNPYVYPGFSLHDELALLVEAGLEPLDALRAATLNPARYFGATDSLGTVAPGKLADLVLLDADPLADIGNTRRIRAVFLGGRVLDRAALDQLIAHAERAAAAPSPSSP
ncbi:MAG TPA: amidohydrolase family protein [Gemmatimonadaceae bacterium]|nr:amidohydrolase family protein [Gemmatimonadaceae bacterium]